MSKRWYKRCGADFIDGTMKLTLEEKGAYSLCLDLIYDRGGPIPDDARWLSGVCGVSIRKWDVIRGSLIKHGKILIENGKIHNSRAAFEIVSAEKNHRNKAESGAKGGRKRAENAGQSLKNNDLDQASLKLARALEEIREDKKEEESSAGAREYEFEGAHIRLTKPDFERWQKSFHAIPDLITELQGLDRWLGRQSSDKQVDWFHRVSRALSRTHNEALGRMAASGASDGDRSFEAMVGIAKGYQSETEMAETGT